MKSMQDIESIFTTLGGQFIFPPSVVAEKLSNVKAFIFDWDGVFNNATKLGESGSPYAEPDAMGTNMLRFSYWLKHHHLPFMFILSGENNPPALGLVKRENFHGAYLNFKDKREALAEICKLHKLNESEVAFVYDDILDLSLAGICGLPIQVKRSGSPLFNDYLQHHCPPVYITGNPGGQFAVREICELLIGLHGNYAETIEKRIEISGPYTTYFKLRNQHNPVFVVAENKFLGR